MRFYIREDVASDEVEVRLVAEEDALYLAVEKDGQDNYILAIRDEGVIQLCGGVDELFGFKTDKNGCVKVIKD